MPPLSRATNFPRSSITIPMKYYKIVFGFGQDDYLPITEDELAKAVFLFMQGKGKAVFGEGALRAQDIQRIVPDWHKAKGWNKGYKMLPEDYAEVKSLNHSYTETYLQAAAIAEFAAKENRMDLLNQPLSTSVLALPSPSHPPLLKEVEILANKFKV